MEFQRQILNRLKRSEGQMRGVQKMIEDGRECEEVITQLTAIRSSIDRTMGIIVAENLQRCIVETAESPQAQSTKIKEAIDLIIKK